MRLPGQNQEARHLAPNVGAGAGIGAQVGGQEGGEVQGGVEHQGAGRVVRKCQSILGPGRHSRNMFYTLKHFLMLFDKDHSSSTIER